MVASTTPTPHRTPLQAALGHYCADRHVGREKLAAAAHVDAKTMGRWAAGEQSPRIEALEHLCHDADLPEPVRWGVAIAAYLTVKPKAGAGLLDLNGDGAVDERDLAALAGKRVLAVALANQATMQQIADERHSIDELGRALATHGELIADAMAELEIKQLLAESHRRRSAR